MGLELDLDEGTLATARPGEARDRRPDAAGDLGHVLDAGPMFARAVAGYDRLSVDTYVRWAEDELATAEREREHLLARHLRTRAELDQARALLGRSAGGGELLRVSARVGALLADAADQAEEIRAEGRAELAAASAEARRLAAEARRQVAEAGRELAGARERARVLVAEASAAAARTTAEAAGALDQARAARDRAEAEAATRLAGICRLERRAAEDAAGVRDRAAADAAAALLAARAEVVALLGTGRDQRRRADGEAAAVRDRLDRETAARRAALLAEVAALQERRAASAAAVPASAGDRRPAGGSGWTAWLPGRRTRRSPVGGVVA